MSPLTRKAGIGTPNAARICSIASMPVRWSERRKSEMTRSGGHSVSARSISASAAERAATTRHPQLRSSPSIASSASASSSITTMSFSAARFSIPTAGAGGPAAFAGCDRHGIAFAVTGVHTDHLTISAPGRACRGEGQMAKIGVFINLPENHRESGNRKRAIEDILYPPTHHCVYAFGEAMNNTYQDKANYLVGQNQDADVFIGTCWPTTHALLNAPGLNKPVVF